MADASPEARWLVDMSSVEGYVAVSISASFGGRGRRGHMILYDRLN